MLLSRILFRSTPKNILPRVGFIYNTTGAGNTFEVHNPYKYALSYTSSAIRSSASSAEGQKKGFFEKLVQSSGPLEPYLRLIRLHNPTGKTLLHLCLSNVKFSISESLISCRLLASLLAFWMEYRTGRKSRLFSGCVFTAHVLFDGIYNARCWLHDK